MTTPHEIYIAQRNAGELACIANLERLGLVKPESILTEVLTWVPAADRLPDSDTTVLVWLASGVWLSGWWCDDTKVWLDCESGWTFEYPVTHWADVKGPNHAA